MARLLVAVLVFLALAGCDLGRADHERTAETAATGTTFATMPAQVAPSPTERVMKAIRSCEVKSIVFGRGETTYITFRGTRTIRSKKLDREKVSRVANKHANACNIVIGALLIEETPCPITALAGGLVALCHSIPPRGESGIIADL